MEKFVITPEKLDATIKKKPKEDPVGLFLERFGKALDIDRAVAEKIDFSYLTPAQRAESMWAVFQDAKNLISHLAKSGIENEESQKLIFQKLRQNVGVLKNFYDDTDTQKIYAEQHQRHINEVEAINGGSEKRKILDREVKENQKIADTCARKIFSERGGKSSELDILLFENGKKQLDKKRDELAELIKSNPELGGLEQYQKIKEGSEQLRTENFIWASSRMEQLKAMEEAALSGKHMLISGGSGTGKTRLVEQASLKLTGQINNLTSGKDTRFQDLIAKPKISPEGETYYEYKEIGEAATGRVSTLNQKPEHHGRIVADDEFNLRPEADQTEIMARVASWTPGKKVRMPVTNQEEKIAPNFLFCAMVNLASERYARKKIPPEVLRKFAKVDVGYLEQSPENPEIYEAMLSALMDENGRLRVAKGEISPLYDFREELKTARKDGQEIKQTVNIRELKTAEEKDGKMIAAGGFLWRLAGALNEINKSFSGPPNETVLKAKGEAQFLKDLIIDIGTILGWLKEYRTAGRGKNLEQFFAGKMQKEFLSREAYSMEDRQLVKEFLKHFNIDTEKNKEQEDEQEDESEFEIMTPLEIGLLSPRVKYEKVVSEEPVLTEAVFIDAEGRRVEYRIQPIEKGDKKFTPGQIFKMSGRMYEFLGVDKKNGDPVYAPYKKKIKIESRVETAVSSIKTAWENPETQKEQAIEIDLEKTLDEQKAFYRDRLGLEIDESKIREIWQQNYAEIKSEIEKYGYDNILIIPENLPEEEILNQKLIESMEETVSGKKKKVEATYQGNNFKSGGSFAGVKNSHSPEYRIVLTHSAQNLENHPLLKATRGKNIINITGLDPAEVERRINSGQELPVDCEVEINGQKIQIKAEGESLEEYQIQQAMYFEKTGKHLDEKGWTWLMKSFAGARVVSASWSPDDRQFDVYANDPDYANGNLGLRLSRSFKKLA